MLDAYYDKVARQMYKVVLNSNTYILRSLYHQRRSLRSCVKLWKVAFLNTVFASYNIIISTVCYCSKMTNAFGGRFET